MQIAMNFRNEEGGESSRQQGAEYQNRENKQSLMERREIIKSVAAFATTKGGQIRIGIAPDGDYKGVVLGRGTLEQLANDIKTSTEPPQFPTIAVEGEEDQAIILAEVEEIPIKPVSAYGVPFKRVGRTNQELKGISKNPHSILVFSPS
jgi:predicted HTH transcriptional regulator